MDIVSHSSKVATFLKVVLVMGMAGVAAGGIAAGRHINKISAQIQIEL